jgi:predicted nucleotidyltransferase
MTDMEVIMEDFLTVNEIADKLGISFNTVKSRIRLAGIKPLRKVGRTNVYAPTVIDIVDNPNPVGHPRNSLRPDAPKGEGK